MATRSSQSATPSLGFDAPGRRRVLVVDDHAVVRAGVTSIISADGSFEVVGEASNGRAAVTQAARLRPDVVLLDLSMPDSDGIAAIPLLQALPHRPGIVLFTAWSDQARLSAAAAVGVTGHVLKDAGPGELVAALEIACVTSTARRIDDPDRPEDEELDSWAAATPTSREHQRALVERARRGSRDAWEALYLLSYPRLTAYARRRLSVDDAAEAVTTTFLQVLARLDGLSWAEGGFDAWLYSMCRRALITPGRRSTKLGQRARSTAADPMSTHFGPLDAALAGEGARAVRRACDGLSPEDREVVELRATGGLSIDEVAYVLGVKPGPLRAAESRVLDTLREIGPLEALQSPEPDEGRPPPKGRRPHPPRPAATETAPLAAARETDEVDERGERGEIDELDQIDEVDEVDEVDEGDELGEIDAEVEPGRDVRRLVRAIGIALAPDPISPSDAEVEIQRSACDIRPARSRSGGWRPKVAGGVVAVLMLGGATAAAAAQGDLPRPLQSASQALGLRQPSSPLTDARHNLALLQAALRRHDSAGAALEAVALRARLATLPADDRSVMEKESAAALASADGRGGGPAGSSGSSGSSGGPGPSGGRVGATTPTGSGNGGGGGSGRSPGGRGDGPSGEGRGPSPAAATTSSGGQAGAANGNSTAGSVEAGSGEPAVAAAVAAPTAAPEVSGKPPDGGSTAAVTPSGSGPGPSGALGGSGPPTTTSSGNSGPGRGGGGGGGDGGGSDSGRGD
jgi:RNA polymerase sigma factor (sigma-70 family)